MLIKLWLWHTIVDVIIKIPFFCGCDYFLFIFSNRKLPNKKLLLFKKMKSHTQTRHQQSTHQHKVGTDSSKINLVFNENAHTTKRRYLNILRDIERYWCLFYYSYLRLEMGERQKKVRSEKRSRSIFWVMSEIS